MNDQDELIPDDDPARKAVQIGADDDGARHLAVVGDTYTVLVAGSDTGGRYTLIDMLVPQGGGPPPHRPRHVCSACVRRPGRRSSSRWSATRCRAAPLRRPRSVMPRKANG